MTTVTLNGRAIDVAKAFPLTVGDWKALRKAGVTTLSLTRQAEEQDFDVIGAFALHCLRKADPTVTAEEIDALTLAALAEISKALGAAADADAARTAQGLPRN
jgi:hypothetical protein